VDSLDPLLVERWAAAGLLPFFASQLRDCSFVELVAPWNVLQGAIWPSVLSGLSPGHHGTYFVTQIENGTYDVSRITAAHVRSTPYYSWLDGHGVRCAIVDFPHVGPIRDFKGLHVVDWLSEFQTSRFTVQPAARQREIETRFGKLKPSGGYGSTLNSVDGHRELRRKLEASISMKSMLTKELLERDDLDHVCVVFGEAHKAGHHFWKYMDPSHPDHVPVEPYLRDGLREIYQLIDMHLGALIQRITTDDNLIIFTEHGMQANYRGDHFIAPILKQLGLCDSGQDSPTTHGSVAACYGPHSRDVGRAALHAILRKVAPRSFVRNLRRRFGAASSMDWRRTQVFQIPTDRNSFLRVNLRGREPHGIVAPGEEYRLLLMHLEREFRALVNVDTGRPAVEATYKIHELCPGPRADELPDFAIRWSSDGPLTSIESPRLGRITGRVLEDRTGNHRPGGFLLARGPGIRPQTKRLRGDILQFPTTILALHGIPRPDQLEMPALEELLLAKPASSRSSRVSGSL
jgi:predicted AlkP superfamily phosphohydrolase/phosphomutase